MTNDTPPKVRPDTNLAMYNQVTDLVQTMRIQLKVTGRESARMVNLRPTVFINMPKGGPPKAAPSDNKDPTHEASLSVIVKGLSWRCSIGAAGEVQVRRVPAENTIMLAVTQEDDSLKRQSKISFRKISIDRSTRLNGATSQKTAIFILVALRT
jgi:hypothetical protein